MRNATALRGECIRSRMSAASLMVERDVGKRFHDCEMVNGAL